MFRNRILKNVFGLKVGLVDQVGTVVRMNVSFEDGTVLLKRL